jgi:hypothetical protein
MEWIGTFTHRRAETAQAQQLTTDFSYNAKVQQALNGQPDHQPSHTLALPIFLLCFFFDLSLVAGGGGGCSH